MLPVLKSLNKEEPHSKEMRAHASISALCEAVKERNLQKVNEVLLKIQSPLSEVHEELVLGAVISSNWPQGFDRVLSECPGPVSLRNEGVPYVECRGRGKQEYQRSSY